MKYQGLTKFFFIKSSINQSGCNHLKYAIENNLLDISEDFDESQYANAFEEYFSILDVFGNDIDDISDAIKYFLSLKDKVKKYFETTYKQMLEDYIKDFEISYQGLFTKIDYINIDKATKTITWINISASTQPKTLFLKSKKDASEDFVGSALHHALERQGEISASHQDSFTEKYIEKAMNLVFENHVYTNPETRKLDHNIFPNVLNPYIFISTKKPKVWSWIWNVYILHKNYPEYKIITKIPLIKKTLAPYSFAFENNIFDPNDDIGEIVSDFLEASFSNAMTQWEKPAEKFSFPKWAEKYSTIAVNCFICSAPQKERNIGLKFNEVEVGKILKRYPNKIAMFDFETINDPLPNTDFYYPYSKIVVQISIHFMENGEVVKHQEYICQDLSKKELEKIYNMLVEAVKDKYVLVAYYKAFESSAIREMERVLDRDEISSVYNLVAKKNQTLGNVFKPPILDLMDFFNKPTKNRPFFIIALKRFGPFKSIKKTIELYAGDNNPYKNLSINNGFKAMAELYGIIVDGNLDDINNKHNQLLKYCKQDTLTMVEIYQKILKLKVELANKSKIEKLKILKKLDK